MNKLLLHQATDYQLRALIQSKPHAVLISGNQGSGKRTIAEKLTLDVLSIKSVNSSVVLQIEPEKDSIGIEEVRKTKDFLSRKTTGGADIRRIILILSAQRMTNEAQNAILKSLEEPPEDTMIILTTDNLTALKHTIRSRTQQIQVLPVTEQSALEYFNDSYKESDIKTAYHMSDGRVGLLSSLLSDSTEHEMVRAINDAKSLLKMTAYERLIRVDSLSKQKDQIELMLNGLERILVSGLRNSADKNNETAVRKFYNLSIQLSQASTAIRLNGNPKLVLTDLFLNM